MSLIDIVSGVFSAISSAIEYISKMVNLIYELISSCLDSFPSFITIGLSFIFGLGLLILVIKLVRG